MDPPCLKIVKETNDCVKIQLKNSDRKKIKDDKKMVWHNIWQNERLLLRHKYEHLTWNKK